ncbi:MAG: type II toxin-antitoxin system VapC family toxin [Planctomycetota bacterium]
MVILDTDVITLLNYASSNDAAPVYRRLAELAEDEIAVCMVTFEEQMRGWLRVLAEARMDQELVRAYRKLRAVLEQFSRYQILDFDDASAGWFHDLRKQRLRLGTMDLRIAAVALAHDALLVSRNLVDFQKVPGLRVEDWTQPAP